MQTFEFLQQNEFLLLFYKYLNFCAKTEILLIFHLFCYLNFHVKKCEFFKSFYDQAQGDSGVRGFELGVAINPISWSWSIDELMSKIIKKIEYSSTPFLIVIRVLLGTLFLFYVDIIAPFHSIWKAKSMFSFYVTWQKRSFVFR